MMKCPVCIEQGLTSRVYTNYSTKTLAYYAPYWDEDGIYHNHDNNKVTTAYKCSIGHEWATSGIDRCGATGCDFGTEPFSVEIYNDTGHKGAGVSSVSIGHIANIAGVTGLPDISFES